MLLSIGNNAANLTALISCPVASVLYREVKEEGRRKKETPDVRVLLSPTFTGSDTNGDDMICRSAGLLGFLAIKASLLAIASICRSKYLV
ncbi:MAG: hypothetical protein AAGJ08_20180 [Cyanobacteria bacterium P01_H01_bin.35]